MTLEELNVVINAKTEGFKSEVGKVKTELNGLNKDIANKMKSVGSSMSGVGKQMSAALTLPILAAGGAAVKLSSDYQESLNKVDVAFGNSSKQVIAFGNTTLKSFGISKGTALEMISVFGDMGTSMGQSQEAAASMSTSLVGLAGDLASFKNISLEQSQNALKGIYTGETESLKSLGIIMNQTSLDAYALANGFGKTTSEMTEAEKVNLRYAFVMDATKNAQGDFARTSDGTANSMKTFTETVKELGIQIGEKLLPVITPVVQKITDWVTKFGELDSKTQSIILIVAGVVAAAGPLLVMIGTIITAIGTISTVIGAVSLPILGIVAAVIAVIAVGVLLYKNWDIIKEKAVEVWDKVKEVFTSMADGITTIFNNIKTAITNTVEEIKTAITDRFNAVLDAVTTIFNNIKTAITNIVDGIKLTVITVFDGIKTGISEKLNATKDTVSNIFENIKTTISDKINAAKDAVKTAIDKIKSIFDFTWSLPPLKMPHFSISGSFSLSPPRVPKMNVSWYAQGGVFDKASVIGVGENGREAVMPLDKNTGWISQLASKLNQNDSNNVNNLTDTNFELIDAMYQMSKQIVNAIERKDLSINLGDEEIALSAAKGNTKYTKRTGQPLFAGA